MNREPDGAGCGAGLLILALAALPVPAAAAPPGSAAEARVAPARADLDLIVNGVPRGAVLVLLRDGDTWVDPGDLERAGLTLPEGRRELLGDAVRVSLRSLAPALAHAVDERSLQLRVEAAPELLGRRTIDMRPLVRPPGLETSGEPSAFLDYALEARRPGRPVGSVELGAGGGGWLALTGLSRTDGGEWARGLTSLRRDEPEALRRWTLGDAVATAGALGGGGVLGGLSMQREFSLDPYALHVPLPSGRAVATSPSTLEVYVNGALARRERLAPGTYDLANLPVTSGAGVVRAVLRDAFGRTQELDSRYYFAPGLLGEGQSDYGYHLGFSREATSTSGLAYGRPVLVARHRLGLGDALTAGIRLEATPDLGSGGPSLTWAGSAGELDLSLGGSVGTGGAGGAAQAAWSWQRRRLAGSVRLTAESGRYAHTALAPAADRPLLSGEALGGWGVHPAVTLEAVLGLRRWRDAGATASATGRASLGLGRGAALVLSLTAGRQPGAGPGVEVLALLSWSLGARASGDAGVQRPAGGGAVGSIGAQQALPRAEGFGYRVSASGGEGATSTTSAQAQAQTFFGRYEGEWDQQGRSGAGRASAAGALVWMDGRLLATRPLDSSYALVRVPGVAGVRVLVENQDVGRTDGRGDLLVPGLLPYQANRIGIRGQDVPLDYDLGRVEQLVAPPARGGAVARFAVRRLVAATGTLALPGSGGMRRPVNGELTVGEGGSRATSPVTGEGRFWVEGLAPGRHLAAVSWREGSCRAWLEVRGKEGVADLGTVTCQPEPGAAPWSVEGAEQGEGAAPRPLASGR